jgi:predicted ATPase/class 3 adenylate cyclase/DNA-binding XRE family transcriptional regulator
MVPPSDVPFGDLLRQLRKAAGLTQAELAERAGLSERGLNDLERGARLTPRRDTIALLADALGLTGEQRAAFVAAARRARTPPAAIPQNRDVDTKHQERPEQEGDAGLRAVGTPYDGVHAAVTPPSGTVTFLFTDIEGSTRLLQRLGSRYADVLTAQQLLLRDAFAAHGGYEVDTQGDSFFVAFPIAPAALMAAAQATRALARQKWPEDVVVRVRMGLHTGAPQLMGDHYVGLDVHRAARLAAAGHGGQILLSAAAAELARHDLPDDITLCDLGEHRLKDLRQAERVYQAVLADLPANFPPLLALDTRLHNLPVQPSPILGREREIEDVCRLLRRDYVRLVTLTGPGGSGKTRLSLQVAADVLEAFPDGVWSVRLSRLTDPELVVPTIAQTFELKESGGRPLGQVVQGYLRDKHLLLVLDNFEQVAPAASRIGELLTVCPGVKVLVTSRVALHLRGEHEYAVRPLALPAPGHLPPPERLSQYAAVALFIERAQAALADFAVTNVTAPAVAEICARLDGLPLAIELAAARVKLLPPPTLLKRLERRLPLLVGGASDVDERQQTMRNTLAWSYDLLAPEERRLFRRLAVFVGGCTLEAAEAVCVAPEGAEPLTIDLLDGLGRLVDQSLVQQRTEGEEGGEGGGEPRFRMLHIIREFAFEQLEASGEAEALWQAHARFAMTLCPPSPVGMRAASDALWLAQLEREHDNLRAALGWALDRGEVRLSLRLGVGVAPFWWARCYYDEGRRMLTRIVAGRQSPMDSLESSAARGGPDPDAPLAVLRAWALWWVGKLASNQGDIQLARAWVHEGLDAARASGDPVITAVALAFAGYAELAPPPRDTQRGEALLAEAVALAHRSHDPEVLVRVLGDKFNALVETMGDLDQAQAPAEELLEAARHLDPLTRLNVEAHVSATLAVVAQRQEDIFSARSYAERALRHIRAHGFVLWAASCLQVLAWVADRAGHGERAARLLGASASEAQRQGIIGYVAYLEHESAQASTPAAFGDDAWAAAYEAGRALSREEAIAAALGDEEA